MTKLEHTKIFRADTTIPQLTLETRDCTFNANISERTLDIKFHLASEGGSTSVLLQIGLDDLPLILKAVASAMPESVGTLSDCAALANRKNLEALTEARRVQGDEKARASSLVEKLEVIEEYVSQKYSEAPAGGDEREAAVKTQLEEIIGSLRLLL